jgi:hypothetical protein
MGSAIATSFGCALIGVLRGSHPFAFGYDKSMALATR